VALAGFGKDKSNRELISEDFIRNITTESMIYKQEFGLI
jgi:hypothetical protein